MGQYIRILATLVTFVLFFGCFYDFERNFSCVRFVPILDLAKVYLKGISAIIFMKQS